MYVSIYVLKYEYRSRDTLDALTARLHHSQAPLPPSAPRPCIVIPPNGFGAPATPVFSLPLLLFVQHCRGIVVLVARQARGDRSDCGTGGRGAGRHRGRRQGLHVDGPGDADDDAAAAQPPRRDGVAESAADLRTVLRHLIRRGFSSAGQMALLGGSHGGLSLGLAITGHPELFAAAVVNHGLFDLLRYQLFNPPHHHRDRDRDRGHGRASSSSSATGRARGGGGGEDADVSPAERRRSLWGEEFGCASLSEQDLRRALALSPLHAAAESRAPQTPSPAVLLLAG